MRRVAFIPALEYTDPEENIFHTAFTKYRFLVLATALMFETNREHAHSDEQHGRSHDKFEHDTISLCDRPILVAA
jgi:hypothetical protein